MKNLKEFKSFNWFQLIILFGIPTLLNFIACRIGIPYIDSLKIMPIEITYFLSVGIIVFIPMFSIAIYLSSKDVGSTKFSDILRRMRIFRLSKVDAIWTFISFILLCVASFLIAKVFMPKMGLDATPYFFKNMPLSKDNFWILYVWPLFFFFNIFGEELLWRGYIQPRQEGLNGKWTWLIHGLLWACWHLPMGIDLIIAATPIFFILPAVVQIRKNTTISIIVHSVFGAFGFLTLAFGFVH